MFPPIKTTILIQTLLAYGLVVASGTAKADTYAFRVPLLGLRASDAGNSLSPAFSISPSPLDFGSVNVGQSATASLTIKNTGNAEADELQLSASTNFTLGGGCSSALPAGSQCTESVTFTPTAGQSYSGSLNVSNATVTATTVLSGTGLLAADQISSTTLAFGNQPVGTTSTAQAVQLSNTGNTALAISSVTTTGNFAATQNCGISLAPAASCTVNVTFTPSTGSALTGNLSIATAVGTESVSLTGTGVAAAPSYAISPNPIAFGVAGSANSSLNVTFTNTGSSAFTVGSLAATPSGTFSISSDTCSGVSLAAGRTCSFVVNMYTPNVGDYSGTLSIPVNGTTKTFSITGSFDD